MELCERLPWWVAWLGPSLAAFFGLGGGMLALELARTRALTKLRQATSSHWSERARIALEAKGMVMASGFVSIALWVFLNLVWQSAAKCSPNVAWAVGGGLVLYFLLGRALRAVETGYRGSSRPFLERLRSTVASLLVMFPVSLVVIVAVLSSALVPEAWIWPWVAGVAAAHFVAGTGIMYPIARGLGVAWPARDSVCRAVERAQSSLPARVRGIDELAWSMPNAVALPLLGVVAFTKTAADEMNDDELHAIALHEIGHLRESALVRWSRPARSLLSLPLSVAIPFLTSGRSTTLIALLLPCMLLSFVARTLSRRHEAEADAESAAHSTAYARALETLHRLAGIPAVISKHATHPSLYDRMKAAGVEPDFPRPGAPRMRLSYLLMFSAPLWMLAFAFATRMVELSLWKGDRERAALVGVAIQGSAQDLLALARETHDDRLAELLYARVAAENPKLLEE